MRKLRRPNGLMLKLAVKFDADSIVYAECKSNCGGEGPVLCQIILWIAPNQKHKKSSLRGY